jgi:16S rRNA (cytidine1402-2'-O)-methyltransferase
MALLNNSSAHVLQIIATPIGTLTDLSERAKSALSTATVVFCEDTRTTGKLLNLFQIKAHLVSLHLHNEITHTIKLIEHYFGNNQNPCRAALVSDAGTPAVSDPGAFFVNECHNRGVKIENIPGPSSLACALASNGFLQPRSLFVGFLPRSQNELRAEFEAWKSIAPVVVVAFESPQRLIKTIEICSELFSETTLSRICVHREISKKFEEHLRGTPKQLLEILKERITNGLKSFGECAVSFEILAQKDNRSLEEILADAHHALLQELKTSQLQVKDVCKAICANSKLNAKDLFNFYLKSKE